MWRHVFVRGLLLIWTVFCFGGSLPAQFTNQDTRHRKSCVVPKEEVQVFVAYESTSKEPAVVVTQTQAASVDIDSYNLQLAAHGYGIPPELRADFKNKSKSSCFIEPFKGVPNLRFISKAEQERIFRKDVVRGWKEFHRKYGQDTSMDELSSVGFNSDKTLALLHVSSGLGSAAGEGILYLLERKNGKWVIKWHIETWVT
ncbi:MAG: hypothetical protein ACYDCM_03830 [Candidatus Acidiferrales bacterium]